MEYSYFFLTPDEKILKHIITEGDGPCPQFGQTVLIRHIGKVKNNNFIFIDTTSGHPFEFSLGKNVITGLSEAVASMKLNEHSVFEISPEYGYGSEGADDKIPPNSTLLFDITLVEMKPFFPDKNSAIISGNRICDDANLLFREGKYEEAISLYQKAIQGFAQFYGNDVDEVTTKIYRNLSVAYSKIGQWKNSIYNAGRVIQKIPNDLRAIARLSEGNLKIGNLEEAKNSIQLGLRLSGNNELFQNLKKQYDQEVKEENQRQTQLMKKMAKI
ncbi:peptidyl-prolyl cis-trans isomerase, FKBP-type family protein [Tritrichomonas foetus]|uniref:peptidylprolyl isomerase n=1 Tax=Tritrichomonas foetus TaxID=1144522 RepID=A0A1J4JF47_9EUKA|nr:peptidyl-prolyl cis-trans isomerase, FKBP-type family protein [Tritrichomonas foetus]|eukprot:OHS97822.1 peptidyl-prolyl cis-trans isomerase, FKBP-type family protein [Tritrichomonas foetus]